MSLNVLDADKMQTETAVTQDNSEDTEMVQKISTSEDVQKTQTTSSSEDIGIHTAQMTNTSEDKQLKDIENNPDLWDADTATKTDPMIRNDEAPTGTIPSLQFVSETEPTSDCICRRRPIDLTKRQIMKNVLLISFVFLLNFTAFIGLATIQSSLHIQKGMGVINMAVGSITISLSSLFLPRIVIRLLGHKWCMCVSLVGFLFWMVANGFGVWATMLPASVILGFCESPLFTALSSYLTILARHYAVKTSQETAPVTSLFFGIFQAIYVCSSIFGSIISSTILGRSSSSSSFSDYTNQTTFLDDEQLLEWCGLNDCPGSSSNSTLFTRPPSAVIWTLVGVYVAICMVALLICCVFVDPIPRSWVRNTKSDSKNIRKMVTSSLKATARQMRHVKQLLLIPITMYTGIQIAFIEAEYTKSFVSCFLAISMVGWCLIPASICKSISSFFSGRVTKYTGIIPVLIFGLLMDLSFQLTLWLWTPSGNQVSLFFIVPVFSALADSVWSVQIKAIYGVLFSDDTEAAFSCFQVFQYGGFMIAYFYSSFLCTRVKLQILTSILILGLTLLFVVIFVFRRNLAKPRRH